MSLVSIGIALAISRRNAVRVPLIAEAGLGVTAAVCLLVVNQVPTLRGVVLASVCIGLMHGWTRLRTSPPALSVTVGAGQ
jgi:hypothetical protein